MSSATDAIPLGRLHLRPLQLYLLAYWSPASKDTAALIPLKHELTRSPSASNKLDHGTTFDARQSAENCHDERPSLRGEVLEGCVCGGEGRWVIKGKFSVTSTRL